MNIVEKIKEYVKDECNKHKKESKDGYDFWNEHIKYVYDKALLLARKYDADMEIVSLGALLHDIALIKKVGRRSDHHINGAKIAEEILNKYNYRTYHKNISFLSGRTKAIITKYGISRTDFKKLMSLHQIPNLTKSSW